MKTFANSSSTTYDAVFVPSGERSVTELVGLADAHEFVNEAYKHTKPIGAVGKGIELLAAIKVGLLLASELAGNAAAKPSGLTVYAQGVELIGSSCAHMCKAKA